MASKKSNGDKAEGLEPIVATPENITGSNTRNAVAGTVNPPGAKFDIQTGMPLGVPEELKTKCGTELLKALAQAKTFTDLLKIAKGKEPGQITPEEQGEIRLSGITLQNLLDLKGKFEYRGVHYEIQPYNPQRPECRMYEYVGSFILDDGNKVDFISNTNGTRPGSCIIQIR